MESRSFDGADDRLRMFQMCDVRRGAQSNYVNAGLWEEYRYDALGRRVMVRTRTDGLCEVDPWTCTASVTRFVWAGDNLLWELKQAEGSMAAQAGGNVSYFHAGGIDRPLVITKDGQSIIPHQNWRGQFARGTYPNGTRSDCTSYPASGCTPIQWPGERTSARHELEPDGRIQNWYGGLVDGMRDASGQMYMRNRYYDPKTGQFTQTDPIGLAGGLNAYGFAAGDPVIYSDPYGLSAQDNCLTNPSECVAAVRNWLHNTESGRFVVAVACAYGCVAHTDAAAVALRRAQEENPGVELAGVTSRAARRAAMREQGIPTSRPADRQVRPRQSPADRQYQYDEPGGQTRTVTHHSADAQHPKPHW